MKSWSTIHIFGYGETQVHGRNNEDKSVSFKKESKNLQTLQAVIDDIFSHKPVDNAAEKNAFHVIHLFEKEVRFHPKGDVKAFSFNTELLDAAKISALVDELAAE